MYTAFYGLSEKPFSLTPNPAFLYLSDSHREALAHLVYGLEQGEGFIVLSGEVGTGKTTLCRSLLERIEPDSEVAILFNPSNNDIELLQSISEEFGLPAERRSRRQLVSALNGFLLDCHGRERRVILIVDEAQNLSSATLEQIRLLSNLETASSKLIQIILLGQPELEAKLDSDSLRQLRQRVTVRWSLRPFSVQDTGAYVQHRLAVAAGAAREIFSPAALREVHRLTGGIPRLINVLCDRALLVGYADSNHRIGMKRVRQAAREVPDASRRIGIWGIRKVGWAAAASVGFLVVAGVAWLQWGSGAGLDLMTRVHLVSGSAPELAAVSAARADADRASGTEVTVIVELPPLEAELPSAREDWTDARESDAAAEPGADSGEARLEPPNQQSPAAAVADATRATLALHRLNRSDSTISSRGEALDEIRSRGLGVLEVFDTSFDALRDLNYPALIELSSGDTEGEVRVVALVGIEGGEAALVGVGNRTPVRISLDVVEEYWDGLAWVIWNPYLDIPDVISEGARGDEVLWLQQALSRLGYLDAHVPGVFDASTLRGVARFQGQHAVEPDGVAGPRTQMLIYADLEEFAPPQLDDRDAG
ncbi:MAG TPA: hypothetical protein EYQ54_03660 [Myxococcales bacterium]|nr:hypothetical protein [Myxococcales bacterium]